jgi:hypothetical protein
VTGTNAAAIVTPIVAFIALAAWLAMVFYADSHPQYPSGPRSSDREITGPEGQDDRLQQMPRPRSAPDGLSDASSEPARPDRYAEHDPAERRR